VRNAFCQVSGVLGEAHRRIALRLLVLMLVGVLFEMLGVSLVIPVISVMTRQDFLGGGQISAQFALWSARFGPDSVAVVVVSVLAFIYIFKNAYLAVLSQMQARFAYDVQADVSHRLFVHYLAQPYIFHVEHNSAELIRNVTTEANFFASHALMPGMLLLAESMVLLGLGGVLLWMEPVGTLLVAVFVGGASVAFHLFARAKTAEWGSERQRQEGLRLQHLQQGLGGVKDVKLFGRESSFVNAFDRHNVANSYAAARQAGLQQLPRLWLETLAVCAVALLVVLEALRGHSAIDALPTVGLFAAAAFRLMPSMNRVLTALQNLRYGQVVTDMVARELVATPVMKLNGNEREKSLPFSTEIGLRKASYRYPSAAYSSITEVSLRVAKGETVGIVGSSGAGKSTVVDVLLGLLEPQEGRLEVDGADVANSLPAWRRCIGYVPQTIYLTDDTLRANVAFGVPPEQVDEAAVWRAVRLAQLEAFVTASPAGLDCAIGERGVRLSGGQRQRIGIARALYHDPDVLVLDEATSALDVDTEREVMNAIRAMHGVKTIIVVAHRLSTVEHCDRIYRLDAGRVVAEGEAAQVLSSRIPVTETE